MCRVLACISHTRAASRTLFKAYDARTGKVLWQLQSSAGCNAPPMICSVGGKQYIAVACGGNFRLGCPLGRAVLVFALPGGAGPVGRRASSAQ